MNVKLTDKEKIKVGSPKELYGIMQQILLRENRIDREKEHFWIVGMNQATMILYIELISMGSVKRTLVEPMNVYRVAVWKGATRIIAVHNHPSGIVEISKADEDITDRLIQVGKILGIQLEDHLIISPTEYISFKSLGVMEILEGSIKYVPTYKLIERVRNEERAVKEEAVKEVEKRYEIQFQKYKFMAVDNLLKNNLTLEEITAILDLTPKEVLQILKRKEE